MSWVRVVQCDGCGVFSPPVLGCCGDYGFRTHYCPKPKCQAKARRERDDCVECPAYDCPRRVKEWDRR